MENTNTKSKDKTKQKNKNPIRPETEQIKLNIIFLKGTKGMEKWVSGICQAPHKGRSAETRIHQSRPNSEIGRWVWGSQQRH